ncbi:unnamed protein product [Amoebophrya sp. A25]|nr:unnamed protein product [Amoebophrya sp. A25]|eukprot:GSA25T00008035001.1
MHVFTSTTTTTTTHWAKMVLERKVHLVAQTRDRNTHHFPSPSHPAKVQLVAALQKAFQAALREAEATYSGGTTTSMNLDTTIIMGVPLDQLHVLHSSYVEFESTDSKGVPYDAGQVIDDSVGATVHTLSAGRSNREGMLLQPGLNPAR